MQNISKPTSRIIIEFNSTYNQQNPDVEKVYQSSQHLIKKFPLNTVFQDIFIKATFINSAFSTRIYDIVQIAHNILTVENLDKRIKEGKLSVIEELGKYNSKKGKGFNFHSFATKYAHLHNPNAYPIFDKNVTETLKFYRDNFDDAPKFAMSKLKEYSFFKKTIDDFRQFANAKNLKYAEIDRFLWAKSKLRDS